MKVRYGFVSNSSSTSFLLRKNGFKDIFDLAAQMVGARDDWDNNSLIKDINGDRSRVSIGCHKDAVGISFRTCNYDTFIVPIGDYYVVQTCNNHDWSFMENKKVCSIPLSIIDNLVSMGLNRKTLSKSFFETIENDLEHVKGSFWFPEYGILASSPKKYQFCDKHFYKFFVPAGETKPICLECRLGKLIDEKDTIVELEKLAEEIESETGVKSIVIEPEGVARCPFGKGNVTIINNSEIDIKIKIFKE